MALTLMQTLIGLPASSQKLPDALENITGDADLRQSTVKIYSDCVYYNYHEIGLSFMLKPEATYKLSPKQSEASLELSRLIIDGIDIYNSLGSEEGDSRRTSNTAYRPFPQLPLELNLSTSTSSSPAAPFTTSDAPDARIQITSFTLESTTAGKDLVSALGEPARKGGGGGPSGGSIAIWCDWALHGIMVEFGGLDARGPKAWENGKDARWAILSIYKPAGE